MSHRIKIKHLIDQDLFDQDEIIWASSKSGTYCPCLDEDYWDYYHSLIESDPDQYDYFKNIDGFCEPIYSKEISRRILISDILGENIDVSNTIGDIIKNK